MPATRGNPFIAVPLRYGVPAALAALSLRVLAWTYFANLRAIPQRVGREAVAAMRLEAGTLEITLDYLYSTGAWEQVHDQLLEKWADPEVEAAVVTDERGLVIASADPIDTDHRLGDALARLGERGRQVAAIATRGTPGRIGEVTVDPTGTMVVARYPIILGATPGGLRADRIGSVILAQSLVPRIQAARDDAGRTAQQLALAVAVLATLMGVAAHFVVGRRVGRLVAAARAVASGDTGARARIEGGDEIAAIGAAVDEMANALVAGQRATAASAAESREAAARLALANKAANIGPWDWDLRTNVVNYSEGWKAHVGYRAEELPDTYETWERLLHPEDKERVLAELRAYLAGQKAEYDPEFRMRHRDGSWRWIYTRGEILRDERGQPARMLGCHVDITDRKRQEAERADLEAQLRQSQRLESVGTLVGGIAHDFNNILGAVLGFADVAEVDAKAGRPVLDSLGEIRRAGRRARDLVQRLLTFSRPHATVLAPIDLRIVVDEALRMLKPSLPSWAVVQTSYPPDLPRIVGDAGQINQVVVNLVANAWQAFEGQPGTIRISLAGRDIDAVFNPALTAGRYVELTVADTGKGMDPATLARLFEPFFTTKGQGEGTGLGLSVVHGIVRGHHGAITVESQPGAGAMFRVFFPVAAG